MKIKHEIKLNNESGDPNAGEPVNSLTVESETGDGIARLTFGGTSIVIADDEAEELITALANAFEWGRECKKK